MALSSSRTEASRSTHSPPRRKIVILGGGFAGVHVAHRLEKLQGHHSNIDLTLVSRDNFFLMTPLLFEACSGTLELRHCSLPIRAYLKRTRFIEAFVEEIDVDARIVSVSSPSGTNEEVRFDELVLALGAQTDLQRIPGSDQALTFKTLADAVVLRNHVIECFERADVERDRERKRRLMTFVVVGAGLVGTELFGELTAFAADVARFYPHVDPGDRRFVLLEAGGRVMPEVDEALAGYAMSLLRRRRGVEIQTNTPVRVIAPPRIVLANETLEAETIVLAAGITPNPLVASLPLHKDGRGRVLVDAAMHTSRQGVWALGDCAVVPGPDGKPYPTLAQHAMREAKLLAENLRAATMVGRPRPFVYKTLGVMASLGHERGLGRIFSFRLRGFLAWWVRRTYYLAQMPKLSRKARIVIDWTVALLFRPDIVKVDLGRERAILERHAPAGALGPRAGSRPLPGGEASAPHPT